MTTERIFPYGERELEVLCSADPVLGKYIGAVGKIERGTHPHLFEELVRSIIAQQISGKAAVTVSRRVEDLLGVVTPERLLGTDPAALQQCGLSFRKVGYLRGIAAEAAAGRLDQQEMSQLSDEEIVRRLSALSGVGVWTAEMLLIFCFERLDVVSWGDLGIRRGMKKLYGLEELTRADFERLRAGYSPYGTVASLYLWRRSVED